MIGPLLLSIGTCLWYFVVSKAHFFINGICNVYCIAFYTYKTRGDDVINLLVESHTPFSSRRFYYAANIFWQPCLCIWVGYLFLFCIRIPIYTIYYTLHEMLTSILNLMKCCQIIMCGGRSNGVWDAEKGLPYLMRTNTRKRVSKTFLFFI